MVNQEEYSLLTLLQSNPTITLSEIAGIFQYGLATAKRKVDNLRDKGLYSGKYAQYYPEAIGLTKYIALLFVDKKDQLELVEQALREHPYTIHRSRIYSPRLGIYSEFNFPLKNANLLRQFFSELKKRHIIRSFEVFQSTNIERSFPLKLEKISLQNLQWNFDWEKFSENFDDVSVGSLPKPAKNVLPLMKPIDFKILRVLTSDADISKREISRRLKEDRTKIWRRINFLEKHVISDYKSKINRKEFNITSNKIIFLDFQNESSLKKFFNAFSNEKIRPPFRYKLAVLYNENNKQETLLLYISLSQHHEAQLFYFINDFASIRGYDIDAIGTHGVRYSLYEHNYDAETGQWKATEEYLVSEPIKNFERLTEERL